MGKTLLYFSPKTLVLGSCGLHDATDSHGSRQQMSQWVEGSTPGEEPSTHPPTVRLLETFLPKLFLMENLFFAYGT